MKTPVPGRPVGPTSARGVLAHPPPTPWLTALWAFLFLFCLPGSANAQLPGAIYTTDRTGTTVNGNLYETKQDVYLNGGPQSNGGAKLPDGTYYFQVTDPSGAVLLSTDDISLRQLEVVGGYVLGAKVPGHANGDPWLDAGGMVRRQGVQLYPYSATPNSGGVYKVWMTPVDKYAPGEGTFGFVGKWSKTDNFKVRAVLDDDPVTNFVIRKYHDRNADGTRGAGEESLAGWQFTVSVTDVDGNPVTTTPAVPTTDASGEALVVTEDLAGSRYPLQWKVREVQQSAPWQQTEPNSESAGAVLSEGQWCWSGTDTAGGAVVTVDFGNAQVASLAGTKYHDQDADAVRQPHEPGLPGFSVQIVATLPDGSVRTQTAVSAADGRWSAGPFPYGTTWTATEATPAAPWRQTAPAGGIGWSGTLDADRDGIDFGNARYYRLRGVKYHDQNGNGARDPGEPGLAGWTFHFSVSSPTVQTAVSAADGTWTSDDEYREGLNAQVWEDPQDGWQQTEPPAGDNWLGPIDDTVVHFGNARWLKIAGFKYHDANFNEHRDAGEGPLSGFLFRATIDDPRGFTMIFEETSDADGKFDLPSEVLEGSTYTIEEVLVGKPGWQQTQPEGGTPYTGILQDNLTVVFGNIQVVRLTGRKYYDCDRDGVISGPDARTSGLGGIRITVSTWWGKTKLTTENVLTQADGTWSTNNAYRIGTRFTVSEVVPPGWLKLRPANGYAGVIGTQPWPVQADGTVEGLDFLNIKLGGGGGIPVTYWCTQNGLWSLTFGGDGLAANLAFLSSFNLVGFAGLPSDPDCLECFCCWLHVAGPANMSYALSAQLASTVLSIHLAPVKDMAGRTVGGVDPSAIVWAPGTLSGGTTGYATVGALVDEANQFLAQYPSTFPGSPMRARALALKNALERINKNLGFVLPCP